MTANAVTPDHTGGIRRVGEGSHAELLESYGGSRAGRTVPRWQSQKDKPQQQNRTRTQWSSRARPLRTTNDGGQSFQHRVTGSAAATRTPGDVGAYGGLCAGLSAPGGHESDDAGRGTVDVPRLSIDGQIDEPVRSLPYVADAADPLPKGLLVRHFTPPPAGAARGAVRSGHRRACLRAIPGTLRPCRRASRRRRSDGTQMWAGGSMPSMRVPEWMREPVL